MNTLKIKNKISNITKKAQTPKKLEFLGAHTKPSLRRNFIKAANGLLSNAANKMVTLAGNFEK